MRKRSKKQPLRNTLLKIKQERVSLDALQKENQRLKANLLYKRDEAQELLHSAAKDKDAAEKLRIAAEKELRQVNPYHTTLFEAINIGNMPTEYALRYRLSPPSMGWDDNKQMGVVRLTYYDQKTDNMETVAYGISAATINQGYPYASPEIVEHIGKGIAAELMELATKKMKEWYKNDNKNRHTRGTY